MARDRGRDSTTRDRRTRPGLRPRELYVLTEGEVTEPGYVQHVRDHGTSALSARTVVHFKNLNAPTKRRKPLPLVDEAASWVGPAAQVARAAGIKEGDWNWPQVWCFFDRDQHPDIPTALARAERAGVRVAYSHPCFELWRLLHYQNWTSGLGGVCDSAATALRGHPAFVESYGAAGRRLSADAAKHVKPEQLTGRYAKAGKFARQGGAHHTQDPTRWDPYTDVWRFVEEGLGVTDY